jgi:RNA polymerase sigma factor (sigma-70 family)
MPDPSTAQLQDWLARWNEGDRPAGDELIRHTCTRLRRLTQRMLGDYPRVRQFEQTDDVFQTALMRLHRALEDVKPPSLADYYRLAALQVRRALIDLARPYFGPEGAGRHLRPGGESAESTAGDRLAHGGEQTTYEPGRLADWGEFHSRVEDLPDEERQVFELLWYHDHTQADAADLLGVSLATVKRRWLSARLLLQEALKDHLPSWERGPRPEAPHAG